MRSSSGSGWAEPDNASRSVYSGRQSSGLSGDQSLLLTLASALHKYRATAAMSAAAYVGDSPLFLFDYLLRLIRVLVLLSIWRLIVESKGAVSGMSLETLLTYTVISAMFSEILECRTDLPSALWDGSITGFFLQPMALVGQAAARNFGRWGFACLAFSVPLFLIAPLLGVNPLPASPAAGAWFVVSLVLSVGVGLAVEFIFVLLIAGLDQNPWGIERLRSALTTALSGALVPLALMPWGIGEVFAWLPYASMASAPLKIYTGTGEPRLLIPLQLTWAIALSVLARWMWRRYREKLVGYGG